VIRAGIRNTRVKRIIQIASLPTIHLCLCVITILFLGQDVWDWMFVTLMDIPVLVLMGWFKPPPYDSMTITISGTVWWLCIGIGISFISESLGRGKKAGPTK
jgi:hypothetical protein